MEKHLATDVFTPSVPARLNFIERESINIKLVNALQTPGKQIVVYGYSGSGKTTLLANKLQQTYENHITSRCISGMTLDQLIIDAFDQLSPYYDSEFLSTNKSTKTVSLSARYLSIKSIFSSSESYEQSIKKIRSLPPQLTAQNVAAFFGQANLCWVIEDFHKINDSDRSRLSQVMKVFMDMADEYKDLKIIAIGAVSTARQVVEYEPEMSKRVAEIYVPLMDVSEISEIVYRGGKLLNITFGEDVVHGISKYANGLASVCHHLCLNICLSENIYETSDNTKKITSANLNNAVRMYIDEASDTLKKTFDKALNQIRKKYANSEIILTALSELKQDGASRADLYKQIKINVKDYPPGNLSRFLIYLESECNIVKHDRNSGLYSFVDPIYRAFSIAYFSQKKAKTNDKYYDFNEIIEKLNVTIARLISDDQ